MSKLVDFYLGETTAGVGWHSDIVGIWTDEHWEMNHDFIQWIFPLKTPSSFNPDAPLLSEEDIETFKKSNHLHNLVLQSFERFLRFVGLEMELKGGTPVQNGWASDLEVKKGRNWEDREWIWKHPNHNWLRITRVIASLKLLGLDVCSKRLFEYIQQLYNDGYGSPDSFGYWQKAAEGLIE
jgi:hypothetical protein